MLYNPALGNILPLLFLKYLNIAHRDLALEYEENPCTICLLVHKKVMSVLGPTSGIRKARGILEDLQMEAEGTFHFMGAIRFVRPF